MLIITLGKRDLVCQEDKNGKTFKKAFSDYSRKLFIIGAKATTTSSGS